MEKLGLGLIWIDVGGILVWVITWSLDLSKFSNKKSRDFKYKDPLFCF